MKLKSSVRQNPPDLKAPQFECDILVDLIGYFQHVIVLHLGGKKRQKETHFIFFLCVCDFKSQN